jgi:hypothetical protein
MADASSFAPMARTALLLGPTLLAMLLLVFVRLSPRQATAAMLGGLWQLPALLLINLAPQRLDWWRLQPDSASVLGLPIDLWIAWSI